MCTLMLGRDVLGPGTIVLAANRDEDPSRPSARPARLGSHPPIAGGRDLRAGGTWLAVRGGTSPAAAALLNRPPEPDAPSPTHSRGELPLALLTATEPRDVAFSLLRSQAYGPCTLLWLSPTGCWSLTLEGGSGRVRPIGPGWHAITHADMDDRDEPRTDWLLGQLTGFAPASMDEAWSRLTGLLVSHGGPGEPSVCLHEGVMQTVSASRVWITPEHARYSHAEGRPCETRFEGFDELLAESPGDDSEEAR